MRDKTGLSLGLAVCLVVLWCGPAPGEELLFSRKLYAYIGLGVSAVLFKEAYNSRQQGGDLYQRYKAAETSQRAQELYDETRRYDTRGVVLGVLGTGALVYSIHILRSASREELPMPRRRGQMAIKGLKITLEADPLKRHLGLLLSKPW